jgi:hypothetical protein
MKCLGFLFILAVGGLFAVPSTASAQCISPEHCHNLPGGSQFCEEGESGWTHEECDDTSGFCQFSGGLCNPAFEYDDFAADVGLTPLGTLRSASLSALIQLGDVSEFKNCQGYVVVAKDKPKDPPALIVLD